MKDEMAPLLDSMTSSPSAINIATFDDVFSNMQDSMQTEHDFGETLEETDEPAIPTISIIFVGVVVVLIATQLIKRF